LCKSVYPRTPESCQGLNRLCLIFGRSEQWFYGHGHVVFLQSKCCTNQNGAVQQFHYKNLMLRRNVFAIPPMDCGGFVAHTVKASVSLPLTPVSAMGTLLAVATDNCTAA
jgi:hypothetical protein